MIGERLKELRTNRNLTIAQTAEALQMNANTYAKYERNERDVSTDGLCQIADFYNVTADYLLGRAPQTDPIQLLMAQNVLTPQEIEEQFSALPEDLQAIVLALIKAMNARREQMQQTRPASEPDRKQISAFSYNILVSAKFSSLFLQNAPYFGSWQFKKNGL